MKLRVFPGIVFALLGMNFVIVGITVYAATGDPAAAVEPDYYQKAVHWDDSARRTAASRELGWSATVTPEPSHASRVVVHLADRAGKPVDGATLRAEVFHHARSGERTNLTATASGPGVYTFEMPNPRAGIWQFRLEASRENNVFLYTVDRVLPAPATTPTEPRP